MWYDAALGVRLMTSRTSGKHARVENETAWLVTTALFCLFIPIDFCNFVLRTSIPLEKMPRRSHFMNLLMEVPMLGLNVYIILQYAPRLCDCARILAAEQ